MSEALLAHATQTIAVGSKSFAAAARLFAPDTRRSALMLYAWCRHCDDVVDGQELGFGATPAKPGNAAQDRAEGEARLATLYTETRRAYAGEALTDPAFAAFQEVALKHRIPEQYAFEHLDGFAMDVRERKYETLEDTLSYCYHVAGVVGLMMAVIMGVKDEATLDRACDLGLAFQLTNIARDIVDDAAVGRCYVPSDWLRDAGIPLDRVGDPAYRAQLAPLGARLVDEAEPYYASALEGVKVLPGRSAWSIATARGVYRDIGVKVKALGARAWDKRVSTSKADKLRLLSGAAVTALRLRGQTPAARPAHLWARPRPDLDPPMTRPPETSRPGADRPRHGSAATAA
ncbi:15-cis-phytoene synthase CrtB [Pigmentiphaga litoralis]|uniref:15-cis-phytoene synthase CrtB n=1 Tax=Pigmentiphaga litoralis TaxID=516702 RepID=UPI003B4356EB